MPFLKDRSFSSRITGGRAARPAGGTRVVGTAKSRIGVGPSLFGSRGYTTRPKLDIWLKKQSRKQRDFGKIYKKLPNETNEQRIKRVEQDLFGNIKGKYGRYIERNRPRSFSEINIRGKELKRELDTGKVKSDPNLKKQKKYNVALIEKMRGE